MANAAYPYGEASYAVASPRVAKCSLAMTVINSVRLLMSQAIADAGMMYSSHHSRKTSSIKT